MKENKKISPIDEEVEEWAERERRRREAWLSGPSELEKRDWARQQYHHRMESEDYSEPVTPITDEEVEEWAERERKRRQAWLSGPSELEKRDWARRQYHRRRTHYSDYPYEESRDETVSERSFAVEREAELAAKGFISWFLEWPHHLWANMVETGRETEDKLYRPTRRRRIKYCD
jgi:hypothetical protein